MTGLGKQAENAVNIKIEYYQVREVTNPVK